MARSGLMGAAWSSINAGASVVLPFLVFVFFAHVLSPARIGLVVLAVSCVEFVKAIGLSGLYEALLQQSDDRQRFHETALAVLTLASILLLAIYLIAMVLLARVVDGIAADRWVMFAIGLRVPLDLATLQPQAALAQRLAYGRMAIRAIIANVIAGLVGIGIALAGSPMLGLAAYQVGQSLLILLTTVLGTGALVRPRLHRACLERMVREASMSSIVRLVAATNNYVDQIIIATLLSSTRLAYFNVAKRVETVLITASASVSGILLQPLFASRGAKDREQVLRKGLALLMLLCGLPTAFLIVNASQVVPLLFGSRWAAASPVVLLLAVAGLARALGSVHGALLSVSGRNQQLAVLSTVSAVSGIVAVLFTVRAGIVWCAAALALKNILITAWLAMATRDDVPRPAQAYLIEVVLPLGFMILGAMVGRTAAAMVIVGHTTVDTVGVLSASLFICLLCCAACHAPRLIRSTPVSVSIGG
jgi:teichuronic acid exporter